MKGIIISGAKSGVGKTTITMAIMKALENVAPFKVGPDFIDPKFHEYATKNKSYNLDAFLLGEEIVKELFYGFCCKKLKKLKLGKLIPNFYRIYATTPIIFLTKLN